MPALGPAWQDALARWQTAGLIDEATAGRIRDFEAAASSEAPSDRAPIAATAKSGENMRWPAIVALAFGGVMLIAGILLFVSAHWDELSPAARFTLIVLMVAACHAAGAFAAPRIEPLSTTLHGVGTASLGAGIFLAGQIFNLEEHWPSGIMLWAAGAWIGWAFLRDWVQLSLAAILTPAWLAGEWMEAHFFSNPFSGRILSQGMLLLAITYFTAETRAAHLSSSPDYSRRALKWIGGIFLLPWAFAVIFSRDLYGSHERMEAAAYLGYTVAFGAPLVLAVLLRRRLAWMVVVAAIWVAALGVISSYRENPILYLWCGLGSAGFVMWGIDEHRVGRINIGMASFAITILCFYFSSIMDKLDRAVSLIGLGVLFLGGGWALERLRRRLVAHMRQQV